MIFPLLLFTITAEASGQGKKERDWFWVFYENTVDSGSSSYAVRPFYIEGVHSVNIFQASLMPVFFWRYRNDRKDDVKGFLGLYESVDYTHESEKSEKKGKKDYDSGLFPLFLYGSGDTAKDRYLFVYPAGGTMRGKFAYDRISPYVFPGVALFFLYPPANIFSWTTLFMGLAALIPVYTVFEDRDYRGGAILWPLISWGHSSKRSDFRIIPFYAHQSKPGWYDNYSYLLLFNYRELYLSKDTRYTFFFFPVYGRKWSREDRVSSHTILWPFFSWGYDKDSGDEQYNLPWPIVQIEDCEKPKLMKRIFFPLGGHYKSNSMESAFVGGPFYFGIKTDRDYFKAEYHITLLIFWSLKREYRANHEYYGKSWRYFKFWPLFQVEWNDAGLYSFNMLSLLPFRDPEGYEMMYQPFWTLYEYTKKPDGEKRLGLLLRTYYQVWDEHNFRMKIPLLVSYESGPEGVREFKFILSAFGYEKNRYGTRLRFLWLPIGIGGGDNDAEAEQADAAAPCSTGTVMEPGEELFNPCHANIMATGLENNAYFQTGLSM